MNKFKILGPNILAAIVIILAAFPVAALPDSAISSIEIPLNDAVLKPGTGLKLKLLALKTNPGIAINDAQLLAVEVSAKSRIGKGKMRLRVGNSNTGWKLVGGSEKTYNSNEPDSFVTIKFRSPQAGEKKVWQLFVNGNIKIRKIILYTAGGKSAGGQSI